MSEWGRDSVRAGSSSRGRIVLLLAAIAALLVAGVDLASRAGYLVRCQVRVREHRCLDVEVLDEPGGLFGRSVAENH